MEERTTEEKVFHAKALKAAKYHAVNEAKYAARRSAISWAQSQKAKKQNALIDAVESGKRGTIWKAEAELCAANYVFEVAVHRLELSREYHEKDPSRGKMLAQETMIVKEVAKINALQAGEK